MNNLLNLESGISDSDEKQQPESEKSDRPEHALSGPTEVCETAGTVAPEPFSMSEHAGFEAGSLPDVPPQDTPDDLTEEPATAPSNADHDRMKDTVLPLIQTKFQSVFDSLDRFETQLADHLRTQASCSHAALDYLYNEMQAYKKNFLSEAQRPLILDLITLYDSIDNLRRHYEHTLTVDPATLVQNLSALQIEAEEILGRVGIDRMLATPEKLDVKLQRAVNTQRTDDPEEHLLVVEHIKAGFISGEQPLRKEQVVVKKYSPRTQSTDSSNTDTSGIKR